MTSVTSTFAADHYARPGKYEVKFDCRGGTVPLEIEIFNNGAENATFSLDVLDTEVPFSQNCQSGDPSWIVLEETEVEIEEGTSKVINFELVVPFGTSAGKYEVGIAIGGLGECLVLADVLGSEGSGSFPVWLIPALLIGGIVVLLLIWKYQSGGA